MKRKLDNRTTHINNHFVPKFYLQNFTFDGKRCYIIRNGVNKVFTNSISTIAYEKYLNSEGYEKFLGGNYENRFAECIDKIDFHRKMRNSGLHHPLYPGCWDLIFDFAAFMWSHNKYTRELIAQNISDDVKKLPEFSSIEHEIRCNDFYAKDVFECVRNDIDEWKLILRMNPDQNYGFITSDNPCRISRVDEDLLKNINSPSFTEDQSHLFTNNVKVNYNVQSSDRTKIDSGKIDIRLDDDSTLFMPLTHDMYLMLFKNHDVVEFLNQETNFRSNDIRGICNWLTYVNRQDECYSKVESSLSMYLP